MPRRRPLRSGGAALAALLLVWLLSGAGHPPAAWADSAPSAQHYRCDGQPLTAWLHAGAVDADPIPNTSQGTVPGAFVVLNWQERHLQLPRTNDAGAPAFSDGRWWWSPGEDGQARLLLRRGPGDVREFACDSKG